MIPATPDEFARWQFEQKLVTDLLARIEAAERAILRGIGYPTDPLLVEQHLAGKVQTRKRSARQRQQARNAMLSLVLVAQTRRHLGLTNENAALAAYQALLLGMVANDSTRRAVRVELSKRGGLVRGAQIAKQAAQDDAPIAKYLRRWQQSDELQNEWRSPATYIQNQLPNLDRRKIERRTQTLRSRQ